MNNKVHIREQRVKTPTVLQMEAVECGAAALAIILGYYKKFISLEELRITCGVSRDGSKAINILKAARKYGFEASGFKYELEELQYLDVPYIVFWNFNHFVVVEGFKDNKVFLNDPATGPRTISFEEFDQSYTGVVLTFTPTPDFKRSGSKPSMIKALKSRLSGYYLPIVYLILVGLALVVPGLLIPIFTKIFIDNYLVEQMQSWIKPLLIGMTITAIARFCLSWLQMYYLVRLETKLAISTSSKFFWHVLRLPIEFFSQRSIGDISNRISLNDDIAALISRRLSGIALNFIVIIFYAALMLYYSVTLTIIGIAIASINLLVLRRMARIRMDKSQQLANETGKLAGTSLNGLFGIETLKASGRESDFFTKWSGFQAKVANIIQQLSSTSIFANTLPVMLNALNNTIILTIGALFIMNGKMTVGMLVAFQSLMASFVDPIDDLMGVANQIQNLRGSMSKVDDVFNYKIQSRYAASPKKLRKTSLKLEGYVEMRNITFGYSRLDPPLLVDFNLSLRPGSRVALVGPSGCGKSTIAKLIMGLYEPWQGNLYFDKKLIYELPRYVFINSVSMVDQEIFLFNGSIKDNITMWDDTIKEEDIIQAAKDAAIHTDITQRERSYDGIIQEAGRNFSGGQRQRLEIARALATNPRIMILDEATSALDPLTEMSIDDSLRRRGCTSIIIAHRLSAIRDCDEIIVLKNGKVMQRGTHDQLKDQKGLYAELIKTT